MGWNPVPDDQRALNLKLPTPGTTVTPGRCLELCFDVALKGVGMVGKNPMVGAVAVDENHRFLGFGAHLKDGEAHAEANLIKTLQRNGVSQSDMKKMTVYCSLEPCSFQGRTPSCAGLLGSFPVKTLIYGQLDSHKRVQGTGISMLESRGVTCSRAQDFREEMGFLSERSLWYHQTKRPFVGLKVASCLDGSYALEKVGGLPVTGKRARNYGHWLRQVYDAIMVGADTVIADNPSLDVRVPVSGELACPTPVVLDLNGRALRSRPLAEMNLLKSPGRKVLWFLAERVLKEINIKEIRKEVPEGQLEIVPLAKENRLVDVSDVLTSLGAKGLTSLLLEGGAGVWSGFLSEGLVQRLHFFQSMNVTGKSGLSWSRGLDDSVPGPSASRVRITPLGDDILIEGRMPQS